MTKKTEAEFAAELAAIVRRIVALDREPCAFPSARALLAEYDAANRPDVTLTLTADEADTLLAVTRKCSGDPATSRRKHTDAIRLRLDAAGAAAPLPSDPGYFFESGGIYFKSHA